MNKITKRGYCPDDEYEFGSNSIEKLDNVITSDAIILDKCKSWINLNKEIIENSISDYWHVDFESKLLC